MRSAVVKEKPKDKNVVICRLKKASKRFELSFHKEFLPTKADVKAEKAGAERIDWNLALTAPIIFSNAAKSEAAKPLDIADAFPLPRSKKDDDESDNDDDDDKPKPQKEIYLEILARGELLLSTEQRAEAGHKEKEHLAQIAAGIVHRVYVRPESGTEKEDDGEKEKEGGAQKERVQFLPKSAALEAEDGAGVKKKAKKKQKKNQGGGGAKPEQRLGLFSQEEIERELKNAKFKPVSTELSDQVVEGIAALAHSVALIRCQSAVAVMGEPDTIVGEASPDMAAVQQSFASLKPGYVLALPLTGGRFTCVFDPDCKEKVAVLTQQLGCKFVEGSEVASFLPSSREEDLSLTMPEAAVSQTTRSQQHAARLTKKEKKAAVATTAGGGSCGVQVGEMPGKGKGGGSDSDGGEEEEEEGMGMKQGSIEAQLAALQGGSDNDDDDDDGGRRKKKRKGGGATQQRAQPTFRNTVFTVYDGACSGVKKEHPLLQGIRPKGYGDWEITILAAVKGRLHQVQLASKGEPTHRIAFAKRYGGYYSRDVRVPSQKGQCRDLYEILEKQLMSEYVFYCPTGKHRDTHTGSWDCKAKEACPCVTHPLLVADVQLVHPCDGNFARVSWETKDHYFLATMGTS